MPTLYQEFVKTFQNERWRSSWSSDIAFSSLESAMRSALNSVAALEIKNNDLKKSGKYTSAGLTEEARAVARREVVPVLKKAVEAADAAEVDLKSKRAALATPAADPADMIGAILRGEMRQYLRSIPQPQAFQMLMNEDVDQRLLLAALEVPPPLAGLTDQMRSHVQDHILTQKHGRELTRLDQLGEGVEVVRAAIGTALYQLRRETGFGEKEDGQFDAWMKASQ